ncbi:glycosyltransferase family 2 protein [Faecalibacterium hattorii]|jgi:GT2 family glycosyltransferase|uniref:Glycosyltransferase n=1 Tax=Faecalibacterium hattorii TaxID=2935520 RepID=A0A329ULQ3_9FIRM|nr:glycosyltransferase family 2 protein [Faecalibacterium hattorii]RAW62029.1 glycosyltransferase [Faecalibacterium hattorii]
MNVRLKRAKELAGYAVQLTKDEGLGTMLARGAGFVKRRCFGKKARYLPTKKVLEAQRAELAGQTADSCGLPTISILTPLYNTPEPYLREFLNSFVDQTAPNGQLCLADASDAEHDAVKRIVEEYQAKNQRIVYKKIENKGIAANTNAAASLATGDYLALADHDDILAPHAMYTMGKAILQLRERGEPDGFLYSDEALFSKSIQRPIVAHFKPDYAPDYLLCCNYICHLAVFQKALWDAVGGERPECDGSQDHDLFLRLIEQVGGAAHVPQVLYYWRVHAGSTSGGTEAKPYVAAAAKKALADHLARTGRTGTVEDGLFPSTYRVKWDIEGDPKVSILIPNKDHTDDLEKCLQSIWKKTTWDNYEIIVIENNSTDPATFAYYEKAKQRYDGLKVVTYPEKGFNFSGINNFGRKAAAGDYLLLLNNDVEVRNGDWLTELLRQCAHKGGAAICGAMLYYPDETLQHAGVITGLGGYAGHSHKYKQKGGSGYLFRIATVQDFSAVTGACLLVKASVYDEVGGLDEQFAVAFNDVDFCLRVRDAGCRIAWTPYAELTHYESKSRGGDEKDPAKAARFAAEQQRLYAIHGKENILDDPYYNPNLTRDREDFSESDDLRGLKAGKVTVRFRGGEA